MLAAILAKGHVLLEDFPGLGKTLAARSFAQALGLDFARAQFTPDLLPADLTGSFLYDQRTASSSSGAGRCSPGCCWPTRSTARRPRPSRRCSRRCRSARSPSRARPSRCPSPFHVLATANPIEYEGTYPLPGGPARPVPAAGRASATRRRARSTTCSRAGSSARREEIELDAGHRRRGPARACRRPSRRVQVDESVGALLRGAGGGHPRARRRAHRGLAARLARPGAARPGLRACCAGGTT